MNELPQRDNNLHTAEKGKADKAADGKANKDNSSNWIKGQHVRNAEI